MEYQNIKEAIFLRRPNRFIAHVLIDGQEEIVHVKNTGRCRELLTEGARVILEKGANPGRKTKYSIIAVYKGDILINMDSQVPNAAAEEALKKGRLSEIGVPDFVRREMAYGESRLDLYYENNGRRGFIEVKGVTLEENGVAMFPDAPTQRGEKHVMELMRAREEGYEAGILFLIQMKGPYMFRPNRITDPKFAEALKRARGSGVKIMVYDSLVTENSILLDEKVEYEL